MDFFPFSQQKVILSRDKLPSEELCTRAVNIRKGLMVKYQDLYQCANSTVTMVSRLLQHQDPQQCKYTPDSPEWKCGIDFAVLCCTLMDLNGRLLLQTAWQKLTKIIYFSLVIKDKAKQRWSQSLMRTSLNVLFDLQCCCSKVKHVGKNKIILIQYVKWKHVPKNEAIWFSV